MALPVEESRWRRLIEECFWREAGANAPIPSSFQDLIESGALDSMGWVSFLRALESASGINDLGALLTERSTSAAPASAYSTGSQPLKRSSLRGVCGRSSSSARMCTAGSSRLGESLENSAAYSATEPVHFSCAQRATSHRIAHTPSQIFSSDAPANMQGPFAWPELPMELSMRISMAKRSLAPPSHGSKK